MSLTENKVLFTGDTCFVGVLEQSQFSVDFSGIEYEQLVVNIEQSLYSESNLDKCTVLSSEQAFERGIKALKPTHVGLANNHIHDAGLSRISDVTSKLTEWDVASFGAGENIEQAQLPAQLTDTLWLLGCCAVNKPTLNNIAVATKDAPGLMAAEYEIIKSQLEKNKDKQFILYLHWGEEHIMLPHPYTRSLAKKLLALDNVVAIIGMHPHIILPKEVFNGKPVYYSLGNFLFPNFVIEPPTQLSKQTHYNKQTTSYHKVNTLTLKKWSLKNRTSLVLELNSATLQFKEHIFKQSDDSLSVGPAGFILSNWAKLSFQFRCIILKLLPNNQLYSLLYNGIRQVTLAARWAYIAIKLFNQFGFKHVWNIVKKLILRR